MTAHSSRLPWGLAPLIAEAKQRMRRRRSLVVLLIVLAGLGLVLTFAFRSSGPGAGVPRSLSSVRSGDLRVSVPPGFNRYALRGQINHTGHRPPVIGHLITDFRLPAKANADDVLGHWAALGGSGPPVTRVALAVELCYECLGGNNLPVSITPGQLLGDEKFNDRAVGYRYQTFRFHNEFYWVSYWSDPGAPTKDRAALLRALESIRPAR